MRPSVIMNVAWGAARSLALAPFRPTGEESFLASFVPEGLVPVGDGREVAHLACGCIACGACEILAISPRAVLVASRSLHDLSPVERDLRVLAGLDERIVASLEASCPASIPFGRIARSLERMLDTGPELG